MLAEGGLRPAQRALARKYGKQAPGLTTLFQWVHKLQPELLDKVSEERQRLNLEALGELVGLSTEKAIEILQGGQLEPHQINFLMGTSWDKHTNWMRTILGAGHGDKAATAAQVNIYLNAGPDHPVVQAQYSVVDSEDP